VRKSMLRLCRRGGVPVFRRPHENPNDFSDSARSPTAAHPRVPTAADRAPRARGR
jgi:hypothetical protein